MTTFEAQVFLNGRWQPIRQCVSSRFEDAPAAIAAAQKFAVDRDEKHGLRYPVRVMELTERPVWFGQVTENDQPFSPWRKDT